MSSEHQRLQRQDNRLQTKDQRVNEGYRIDDVQIDKLQPCRYPSIEASSWLFE